MIPTRSAPEILNRARDLTTPALRHVVGRLSDELRPIVDYHLGWADAEGRPTENGGGKGIRPALAVLSAEAVGAPPVIGVPGAVAIQLVHDFSLIHDDVMDEDAERRHRPTVWALFGVARAVIVGDALLALAQQVVLDPMLLGLDGLGALDDKSVARAARCVADATAAMIGGQALDMAFESLTSVDVERCLTMEAGKTGALLGCAASIGAVLAGAPAETAGALERYGTELGLAFQAVDDLLGIWGDPVTTGKPAWSDLRQHKKTLPVVAALGAGNGAAEELSALLALEHLGEHEVARAAALVERCGGRSLAQDEAQRRFASALEALDAVPIVPSARDELADLADFVVEREF